MEATSTEVKRNEWGDYEITATVKVLVVDWHKDPERAAREYLASKLPTNSKYNWEGRFLIVEDIKI